MVFSKRSALALLLVAAVFGLDPTLEEAAALASDDQCDGDQTCSLNALQLRASRKQQDEWSMWGTTEQCCKCKSGTIGWSASGKCKFCNGQIAKTQSVSSDCTTTSKTFKGNQVCANSCRSSVLLEEPAAAMTQALVGEHRAQLDAEEMVGAEDEAVAEIESPIAGTKEQCCKCMSGTTGWSASGKCKFCKGQIAKTNSVSSDCTKKSKTFIGKRACAKSCKSSVLLEAPEPVMMQTSEERRVQLDMEEQAAAEDEAIAEDEWWIFGTTEKCCKCKSGSIGWSASGTCTICNGEIARTTGVSSDCTTKSKNFKGNTACANSCKSSVLLEEHLAELQAAQQSLAEDEALAEGQGNGYGYGYGYGNSYNKGYGNSYNKGYGSSYSSYR